MQIQIIVGSVREGRRAKPIADWVYDQVAKRKDLTAELVDLKEWNLRMFDLAKPPIWGDYDDPVQREWAAKIAQADGYVFVSPEYNHGYTPALKNALDYIYGEWARKPAAFVSYGGAGGARGIEQLRLVLIELRMAPLRDTLHIWNISDKLTDNRFVGDHRDIAQLNRLLEELLWWSHALRNARQGS